jgi:hypothetical protein
MAHDDRGGWVAVLDESIVGFVSVAQEDHWCGMSTHGLAS